MGTDLRDLLTVLARLNRAAPRRSLGEVAAMAHLSPSRAHRVFSRLVGESPGRYQHRVGLDRAAAQLASTDALIIDVALANGFGSHEAFTRAFHRRFGVSPRQYRNDLIGGWSPDQTGLAERTSPCIGLYGRPLDHHPPVNSPPRQHQETSMEDGKNREITVRELDSTPVLYMARRVDKDQFAEVLAEILPAVFQYVMTHGLAMAGPPYVRYLEQTAAFFSIEGGIPLAEVPKPPEEDNGIIAGELPAGPVAVTIHHGPYETLGDSHIALDRWMAENDRTAAGPPWEVYLTDPGEVPDPNDWQTEILWPIA